MENRSKNGVKGTQRDSTRLRLIRVAERLFARHGIDAVSLNEIVHTAKASAAAIHYHFGNREGLLDAIIRERQPVWSALGRSMISELEARPEVTAREVVAVMIEPIAALSAQPWGADYIGFIAELASHRRYASILHRAAEPHAAPYLKQLARAMPDLPDDIRVARYAYLRAFVYQALGATDQRVELWLTSIGQPAHHWTTDDLIDLVTGAMTAPVHLR